MISVTITERSQRRCAPSWLKEKPYLKVRFTDDSVITKVKESWRIKLTQDSKELDGCLTKFTFLVGQIVWCYRKTANEKEKTYFFIYVFFHYKYDTFSWSVPTEPPQQDRLCISTFEHILTVCPELGHYMTDYLLVLTIQSGNTTVQLFFRNWSSSSIWPILCLNYGAWKTKNSKTVF